MRRQLFRAALVCLASLQSVALAVGTGASPEIVPTQEMAEGQALTGTTLLNDALYVNPAAAAFTQAYSLDGAFYLPSHSMNVSILDTKTSSIGGGLAYFRKAADEYGASNAIEQGAKLGLMGRLAQNIGAGIAGKMVWGPNIPNHSGKVTDLDTGLMLNLQPFTLGISAQNIFGGNAALGEYRQWSVGGSVNYQQTLFLSVATVSDWSYIAPYQYGVGVQYVSPYYFSLKGGYRIQPKSAQVPNTFSYWSAGASFISPRLSIHYSVEFPNQDRNIFGVVVGIQHVVGMTLLM